MGSHILKGAVARAAERGVIAEPLDLAAGPAAPAIVAAAQAIEADTIVMGTRGLRTIDVLIFGCVSQEVCRTAGCTTMGRQRAGPPYSRQARKVTGPLLFSPTRPRSVRLLKGSANV